MARLQRSEVAPQTGLPKAINFFKALRANGICQGKKKKRESTVCPYLCFENMLSTWLPVNVGRIISGCRSTQSNISELLKVRVKKRNEASEEACMKTVFHVN